MDTKEAIVRIKKVYKFIDDDEKWRNIGNKIKEFNREERDKIIELLKRGEKFEKIVEEYKKYLDNLPTGCNSLKLYRLLKKYFPRAFKDKDYFYEATSKDPHLKKVPFKKEK